MNDGHPSGIPYSPTSAHDPASVPPEGHGFYDQNGQQAVFASHDGAATGTWTTGPEFSADPLFGNMPGASDNTGQWDTTGQWGTTGQWDTTGQWAAQNPEQDAYLAGAGHDTAYGNAGTGWTGAEWQTGQDTGSWSTAGFGGHTDHSATEATGQWQAQPFQPGHTAHAAHPDTSATTDNFSGRTGQFGQPDQFGHTGQFGQLDTQQFDPSGYAALGYDAAYGHDATGSFAAVDPLTGTYPTEGFADQAFADQAYVDQHQAAHDTGSHFYGAQPLGGFDSAVQEHPAWQHPAWQQDTGYTGPETEHALPAEEVTWSTGTFGADAFTTELHDTEPHDGFHDTGLQDTGAYGTVDTSPAHDEGTGYAAPHGESAYAEIDGNAGTAEAAEESPAEGTTALPEAVVLGRRSGPAVSQSRARARRRSPAKRSALISVAVPSACVMGVAGIAAASVDFGDGGKAEASAPDSSPVRPSSANNKLDTQLDGLTQDADDFADRASRTQERMDLKARQQAERKRAAEEAERREALRPKFALPVKQHGLSALYGQAGVNWMSVHSGIDFPVSYGTPVMAATDGTVHTQWNSAYGNMMVVTAADGTETWYCHLSSSKIFSGSVKAGDVIGYSGNSGNSTGPHLHFEVRPGGGAAVNPLPWLQSHGLDPN